MSGLGPNPYVYSKLNQEIRERKAAKKALRAKRNAANQKTVEDKPSTNNINEKASSPPSTEKISKKAKPMQIHQPPQNLETTKTQIKEKQTLPKPAETQKQKFPNPFIKKLNH